MIGKKLFGWLGLKNQRSEAEPQREWIDRPPRVALESMKRVRFLISGAEPIEVLNLSLSGMALRASDAAFKDRELKRHDLFEGRLQVGLQEFPVQVELRHKGADRWGCMFIRPSLDLTRAIQSHLRIELMGAALKGVREEFVRSEGSGRARWWTDGKGAEIYLIEEGGQITRGHVGFLGYVIRLEKGAPPSIGVTETVDDQRKLAKPSELVQDLVGDGKDVLAMARDFTLQADMLPVEMRDQVLAFISNSGQ